MRRLILSAVLLAAAGTVAQAAGPPRHVVIFFQSWSAKLDAAALQSLRDAADWATRHPDQDLTVMGYASTIGSTAANQDLSRLRAQIVADTLAGDGVPAGRIRHGSMGAVNYAMDPVEARRVEISLGAP